MGSINYAICAINFPIQSKINKVNKMWIYKTLPRLHVNEHVYLTVLDYLLGIV